MQNNFKNCLTLLLKSEGGYVNNPKDPGGRTNLGVTQKTWEAWVGRESSEKEIKALTKDQVAPLYKAKYWTACYGPQLPLGVDYAVFDAAVNMGVGRAVKLLQESLGCVPDGQIGPRTIQLIDQKKPQDVIEGFSNRKTSFYESLSTFATFGKGWLRRVEDVKFAALKMIQNP